MKRLALITALWGAFGAIAYALLYRPPAGIVTSLIVYVVLSAVALLTATDRVAVLGRLGIVWGMAVGGLYVLTASVDPYFSWARVGFAFLYGTIGFLLLMIPSAGIWHLAGREPAAS